MGDVELSTSRSLLDAVYSELGFSEGVLLDAVNYPVPNTQEYSEWVEKGDWLQLAKKVGAEKVFFVKNDPVIVFREFQYIPDNEELLDALRRTWCMARPLRVFVSLPTEVRVYSLNQTPTKKVDDWHILASAKDIPEVTSKLQNFHREQVETYQILDDEKSVDKSRADKRLINDLKTIRKALLATNLKPRFIHALIGRSIFIRYLEDRGVLSSDYFYRVAEGHPNWKSLLDEKLEKLDFGVDFENRYYYRVLKSKEFTYALFDQLAKDFNGDMFPRSKEEEGAINHHHLEMLRNFLLGDADQDQPSLFFWAYDFEVIPIELISSIYEEFYHQNYNDDKGTHYTPSTLVQFILTQTLSVERLENKAVVLDPACGSGTFLVEAFRRIIRYWVQQNNGQKPTPSLLRQILSEQIRGIEINEEAVHVSAFSLYLALLHYQDPPDILHRKLPNLIYEEDRKKGEDFLNILFKANAFGLTEIEQEHICSRLEKAKTFQGKATLNALIDAGLRLPVDLGSIDVIVGNPPWDQVGENNPKISIMGLPEFEKVPSPFTWDKETHTLSFSAPITQAHIKKIQEIYPPSFFSILDDLKAKSDEVYQPIRWAEAYNLPVGDNNYSQLFIHRSLSFLKENGIAGLLCHSSTIYNHRSTSREFRRNWLKSSQLIGIVNFADVRDLFFDKAVAPFIFTCFEKQSKNGNVGSKHPFVYISARKSRAAQQSRSVILTNEDRRVVKQGDVEKEDYLWKTYWWGGHRDADLLSRLDLEKKLRDFLPSEAVEPAFGFQRGPKVPSDTLKRLRPLNSELMTWYGPLKDEWFEEKPKGVKRDPDKRLYEGQRLIIGRGIKTFGICVRLEEENFSFRHTIYSVPLPYLPNWQAKLILGIFWSSLAKYKFFMTVPHWGTWHYSLNAEDILSMPIRMPNEEDEIVQRVVAAVDSIRNWNPIITNLFGINNKRIDPPIDVQYALDSAIFDLFDLSDTERDLITDFSDYKYPFFSEGPKSKVLERTKTSLETTSGNLSTLGSPKTRDEKFELENYIATFLKIWDRELASIDGEFHWRVIRPKNNPMMAMIFEAHPKADPMNTGFQLEGEWKEILDLLDKTLLQPISRKIYIEGIVRAVTESSILIVKRDERRLWTRSSAREDAEATLLQAVYKQEMSQESQL